jgi:DNA-binding transcriptional LysR family regulator
MIDFTLQELACIDAVVSAGSFHAAAAQLHRSHPAVYAAVKGLEARVGVPLLDRAGYRVRLTPAGEAFCQRAREVLSEARALRTFAEQLAQGEETDLRVVVGDLCPTAKVVRLLRRFFIECPNTRLHLHFEALAGPWERLFEGEADIILHHVDKTDPRLESTDLFSVTLVPVVAPGFLPFPITANITPRQMKGLVQCIIRDSAKKPVLDVNIIKGARSWTVGDQLMKKELILLGMGWGHMPLHLIERDLKSGKLLSIEGKHFKRLKRDIVAARLREKPTGPVGDRLWKFLGNPN